MTTEQLLEQIKMAFNAITLFKAGLPVGHPLRDDAEALQLSLRSLDIRTNYADDTYNIKIGK